MAIISEEEKINVNKILTQRLKNTIEKIRFYNNEDTESYSDEELGNMYMILEDYIHELSDWQKIIKATLIKRKAKPQYFTERGQKLAVTDGNKSTKYNIIGMYKDIEHDIIIETNTLLNSNKKLKWDEAYKVVSESDEYLKAFLKSVKYSDTDGKKNLLIVPLAEKYKKVKPGKKDSNLKILKATAEEFTNEDNE